MLYLDNASTTPILPSVKDEMLKYLTDYYGNASSINNELGNISKKAINKSRFYVAKLLDCQLDEVIFTSCATESNNLIIKGVVEANINFKTNRIITSSKEHPSILEICNYLKNKNISTTYLSVDEFHCICINQLEDELKKGDVLLVSISWGTSERGTLNDIEKISDICNKYKVKFHTDATQVVSKIPISLKKYNGITYLTASGHKFHGPKGVGVAIIKKKGLPIIPLIHGGGQEFNLRSGTHSVHNIVGIGKACEVALIHFNKNKQNITELERFLKFILIKKYGKNIKFINDVPHKIPGFLNVKINVNLLDDSKKNMTITSSKSACKERKLSITEQAKLKNDGFKVFRLVLHPYLSFDDIKNIELN